jgi:transketolase
MAPYDSDSETLRHLRRRIIEAACLAKEGHIPSAFSVLDILWVLYHRVLRFTPGDPEDSLRDRFVLSKGHASLALYAVLAEKNFFPGAALDGFGAFASPLGGHPHRGKVPGVEASTGSLGHGLPVAVGMALAMRIRRHKTKVFCLIGDGESNEGSIWEAAALAAHHRLSDLCCIVDHNHSTDRAVVMDDLAAKFAAFGWSVGEVDGHDHELLARAFSAPSGTGPRCIIARTIKGYGCPPMESQPAWHHRSPSTAELPQLLASLR